MESIIELEIASQPDDISCGPTCLHSIYSFFKDPISLKNVIEEVPALKEGGTLAVLLAIHALKRGYAAKIYTYNLQIFDPTWFEKNVDIKVKLKDQIFFKQDEKLKLASRAYIEFLELGGELKFEDLSPSLIRSYLKRSIPLITGLSSTYLYGHAREYGPNDDHDDLRGFPAGHFVILSGYDKNTKSVLISDPLLDNPFAPGQKYLVRMDKLICSILLGIITYDANLLIIEPKIL